MKILDTRGPDSFYPPFYAVHISKELKDAGVTVEFSKFTGTLPQGAREIADIDFKIPPNKVDELKEKIGIIRIYITEEENIANKDILVLKEKEEPKKLHAVFIRHQFEIYAGYLQGAIKIGDPPIAVG